MPLRKRSSPIHLNVTLAGAIMIAAFPASAEFYSWVDEAGQTRISNIPPQGIREDGSVVDTYHPYSIIAQHARMREKLKQQAMSIERAEAESAARKDPVGKLLPFSLDFLKGLGE